MGAFYPTHNQRLYQLSVCELIDLNLQHPLLVCESEAWPIDSPLDLLSQQRQASKPYLLHLLYNLLQSAQLLIQTRGVSHCGLAIYINYIKAKEELWKLKYATT
jgi:AraC-like DNA-binding protein